MTFPAEPSQKTSVSMITGMQAGEEDAWLRMTCLFGPLVFKWINSLSRGYLQTHDVTDVSQEVFLVATEKISTYRHSREKHGSFRGWLYGITRNKVRQHIEKQSKAPLASDRLDQTPKWDPYLFVDDVEGDGDVWKLDQGHTHEAVEAVRKKSEEHTWQAFWRTVVNGEDASAVAEDLGMNPRSVRQAKHRTVKRLAAEVERLKQVDQSKGN